MNSRVLVLELLKKNQLPVMDISENTKLFALYQENDLIGSIGLEKYGTEGLLRSLCVDAEKRKNGAGKELVNFIEKKSKEEGIKSLYLLTTTAEDFFYNRNYIKIQRREVPESIRNSEEFRSICPSTSAVMKKEL
jgi:amino-acid N-acetyltransferase